MIQRIPDYYTEFQCIGGQCKHSCCVSWEIDVDEKSYEYYCKVEGEFGDRLRNSIKKEKAKHFQMIHGKCPFLSDENLCEVYQSLGEQSLCEVCTEYPRCEVEYGTTRENILALSCEEAGRILFTKKDKIQFVHRMLSEKTVMSINNLEQTGQHNSSAIEAARDYCIDLLQDRTVPLGQRLANFLFFCNQVQNCLNLNQSEMIHGIINGFPKQKNEFSSKSSNHISYHTLFQQRMDVLMNMEVMEEEWIQEMNNVMRAFYADSQEEVYHKTSIQFDYDQHEYEYGYEHLMVYFVSRYLIKAVSDNQILDKAKFCVLCYLTIRDMDRMRFLIQGNHFQLEDRIETARIFSKEVEHSEKSLDYLTEKIQSEDIFKLDHFIQQVSVMEIDLV